jgi:hypothetical protein
MAASDDDAFRARLAALVAAFDDLGHEAADDADGGAYRRLVWLVDAMQGRATFWSRIKARVVLARWQARRLSYAELAEHLGVSKQRAVQLVRAARQHAAEDSAEPQ